MADEIRNGGSNVRVVRLLGHRDDAGAWEMRDFLKRSVVEFQWIELSTEEDYRGERAGQPVDLVDNDGVDPPRREVSQQLLQSRPIHRRAGEPAVIIRPAQAHPAFLPLALDEGLAGFTLRLQ